MAFDKIRNFFNPGDDTNNIEEDDYVASSEIEEDEVNDDKITQFRPRFFSGNDNSKKSETNSSSLKEVKILIYEPKNYSEATNIVDSLKNKRVVVLKFTQVEAEGSYDVYHCKKQIFDFVNGAVYAMEGNMKKLSDDIFMFSPHEVDIDEILKQEVEKKGVARRWAI